MLSLTRKPLVVLAAVLAAALCFQAPVLAASVMGQVALNGARLDGAQVPTGSTLLSPALVETGTHATALHLSTGQTVNLAPNSSAYLKTGDGGIELAARSGEVAVGHPSGETFKIASNTVAFLPDAEGPESGDPVQYLKMCRGDGDPVMVEMDEAKIAEKVELGWGVAGVDPYDEDCNKKRGVPVWTAGKKAGFLALVAAGGIVLGDQISDDDTREVQCQSRDASPFVAGVPVCTN